MMAAPFKEIKQQFEDFNPSLHLIDRITEEVEISKTSMVVETGQIPFESQSEQTALSGQQIISYMTTAEPMVDTIPEHEPLTDVVKAPMLEDRKHDIQDILEREYVVETFTIAVGGTNNDNLKTWKPLDALLSQPNVQDKVRGFYLLRADMQMRFEFTVQPFTSGGVIISYYPDVSSTAFNNRNVNRLQRTQTPNVIVNLPTAKSVVIECPWVSPFLARDLTNGFGDLGTVSFSRLTPSATDTVSVIAYVSCKKNSIDLAYPTLEAPILSAVSLDKRIAALLQEKARILELETQKEIQHRVAIAENGTRYVSQIEQQVKEGYPIGYGLPRTERPKSRRTRSIDDIDDIPIKHVLVSKTKSNKVDEGQAQSKKGVVSGLLDAGSKIATIASGIPVVGSVASAVAPILNIGSKLAGAFGFSKTINHDPVKAIKFKPGDGQLNSQGVLPSHQFTINADTAVTSNDSPFGSGMDEMTIEEICRIPNMFDSFVVTKTQNPGTVLAKYSVQPIQYIVDGTTQLYLTHQAWVAAYFQTWLASVVFHFDSFQTSFHYVKLRFLYVPGDDGSAYAVNSVMPADKRNLASSTVFEFSGNQCNYQHRCDPPLNTHQKLVASPWAYSSTATDEVATLATLASTASNVERSFGTLYVLNEANMTASSSVATSFTVCVSISLDNASFSNPVPALSFYPVKHSIDTVNTTFDRQTRSERMTSTNSQVKGNSASLDFTKAFSLTHGDMCLSLKNVLNAFTLMAPSLSVEVDQLLIIEPARFRVTDDFTVTANKQKYIDHIDYFVVGFNFFKGGMNVRIVPTETSEGLVGEAMMLFPKNNQTYEGSDFRGAFVVSHTQNQAKSGTRAVPLFAQEGTIDFNIPYYQPWHISRVVSVLTSTFTDGQIFSKLIFKPAKDETYRIYRSVGDDFRLGFLTALPVFSLATSSTFG